MKEIIDILAQKPATIVVMNAMCEVLGPDLDLVKHFGIDPQGDISKAEIEVKVNGIPVPFTACLQAAMDAMMARIDRDVKEAALEMITKHPLLNTMHDVMNNADWQIKDILDKLEVAR